MGFLYTAASNENTAFDDAYSADYSSISDAKKAFAVIGYRVTEQGADYCLMIGNSNPYTRNIIKITQIGTGRFVAIIKSQWFVG